MDTDEAGKKAAIEIATLSCAVKIIRVPIGKDMNEFYLLAGQQIASDWLQHVSGSMS
jgi:DNA primase